VASETQTARGQESQPHRKPGPCAPLSSDSLRVLLALGIRQPLIWLLRPLDLRDDQDIMRWAASRRRLHPGNRAGTNELLGKGENPSPSPLSQPRELDKHSAHPTACAPAPLQLALTQLLPADAHAAANAGPHHSGFEIAALASTCACIPRQARKAPVNKTHVRAVRTAPPVPSSVRQLVWNGRKLGR
jgi:hypothetical protein